MTQQSWLNTFSDHHWRYDLWFCSNSLHTKCCFNALQRSFHNRGVLGETCLNITAWRYPWVTLQDQTLQDQTATASSYYRLAGHCMFQWHWGEGRKFKLLDCRLVGFSLVLSGVEIIAKSYLKCLAKQLIADLINKVQPQSAVSVHLLVRMHR